MIQKRDTHPPTCTQSLFRGVFVDSFWYIFQSQFGTCVQSKTRNHRVTSMFIVINQYVGSNHLKHSTWLIIEVDQIILTFGEETRSRPHLVFNLICLQVHSNLVVDDTVFYPIKIPFVLLKVEYLTFSLGRLVTAILLLMPCKLKTVSRTETNPRYFKLLKG